MRHQVAGRHLNRTSAHRRALRRNLAASLFEHGTISTTIEKAKFVRAFAEKLITLAKKGDLHARRQAVALLKNRNICKMEDGAPVKVDTVVGKLFSEIAPRFAQRNGGYTRIIRLPWRRIGDNGKLVLLQLVGESQASSQPSKKAKTVEPVSREQQLQSPAPPAVEENESEDTQEAVEESGAKQADDVDLSEKSDSSE